MPKLPPDIAKIARKLKHVRGSKVSVYKVLDTLATPDGDISKIANKYPDISESALRDALHNCAQLLRAIEPAEPRRATEKPEKTSPVARLGHDEVKKRLEQIDRIKIFVDGSTRGNPGPSAYAFVIKDIKDTVLLEEGGFIGDATNNIAEARGIIAALSRALSLGKKKIHLFSDSELIVNQMLGSYRIRNPELIKLHKKIITLRKQFDFFDIVKIDRSLNKEADKLANSILKKALKE